VRGFGLEGPGRFQIVSFSDSLGSLRLASTLRRMAAGAKVASIPATTAAVSMWSAGMRPEAMSEKSAADATPASLARVPSFSMRESRCPSMGGF